MGARIESVGLGVRERNSGVGALFSLGEGGLIAVDSLVFNAGMDDSFLTSGEEVIILRSHLVWGRCLEAN